MHVVLKCFLDTSGAWVCRSLQRRLPRPESQKTGEREGGCGGSSRFAVDRRACRFKVFFRQKWRLNSGGRGCLGEGRLGVPGQVSSLGVQVLAVFSFVS